MTTHLHLHLYKKDGQLNVYTVDSTERPENEKKYHSAYMRQHPLFGISIHSHYPEKSGNPVRDLSIETVEAIHEEIEKRLEELSSSMPEGSTQDIVIKFDYYFSFISV